MILNEYSKFLKKHDNELLEGKVLPIELLHLWLESYFTKIPKNNIEKIIHKEILFCKNSEGEYLIIGKSDSGRILVKSLLEFSNSYSNYIRSKWMNMLEHAYYS